MEDVAKIATKILVMNNSSIVCYDEPPKVFGMADEIAKMGLDIPQITKVFNILSEKGYNVAQDVYTIPYAVKKMLAYLDKGGAE